MAEIENNMENKKNQGTDLRNFMAYRGAVIIKEMRPAGVCKGDFGNTLAFETLILSIVKGEKKEVRYGVKLAHQYDEDREPSVVLLDFDELDELLAALNFIYKTSTELSNTKRDYTEVIYSTKDGAKFGFFQQTDQKQLAFIEISHLGAMFLSLHTILTVIRLLSESKTHLETCGAQD